MKILKTYDFVSERLKAQPITNAELDNAVEQMKEQIKPGDDLKDGDVVFMGYYETVSNEYDSYKVGIFKHDSSTSMNHPVIDYGRHSFRAWEKMKKTYTYRFPSSSYVHLILKVYRPKNEINLDTKSIKNIKKLIDGPDYVCIYRNEELLEKFGLK